MIADEFYQIWHNKIIIPLSEEYDKDLSKNNFKTYFNLTNEQVNHIVYIMVHNVLFDKIADENIVDLFKNILNETRENYEDKDKAILNVIDKNIKKMLNNEGISSSSTTTIKEAFTETIETPHIKNKHGAGTKVLATAVAGPLGFVATSGVKQETEVGKYIIKEIIIILK